MLGATVVCGHHDDTVTIDMCADLRVDDIREKGEEDKEGGEGLKAFGVVETMRFGAQEGPPALAILFMKLGHLSTHARALDCLLERVKPLLRLVVFQPMNVCFTGIVACLGEPHVRSSSPAAFEHSRLGCTLLLLHAHTRV